MQLVERRSAAKRERSRDRRIREELDQCPANDEILLDLRIVDPGCVLPPLSNVVARDHVSISTVALTRIFQSALRGPSRGPALTSGA